jgi:hypothetical protein
MNLNAEAVAEFLNQNPEFFEDKPGLLEAIAIPHPHGGRAISLAERQQLQLREKNKLLESKLRELLQFGEENDAIGEKVHRFSLALLSARTLESLLPTITLSLRDDFAVPHVALRAENVFGLLVMASEDVQRFYPEMGTLYLKRIGELVSVALMPYISEGKDAA